MTAKYLNWVWWPTSRVGKMKLAHAWAKSNLVKGFTLALQDTVAGAEVPADLKEELETMVEWGFRHAIYLDPLTELKWVAKQFKNPPWLFGY